MRNKYVVSTIYNVATWDEPKRKKNIADHGLDFVGCEAIWDNFTVTREDVRHAYAEKRLVTFGLLEGKAVVLVYTERRKGPHIIIFTQSGKT